MVNFTSPPAFVSRDGSVLRQDLHHVSSPQAELVLPAGLVVKHHGPERAGTHGGRVSPSLRAGGLRPDMVLEAQAPLTVWENGLGNIHVSAPAGAP